MRAMHTFWRIVISLVVATLVSIGVFALVSPIVLHFFPSVVMVEGVPRSVMPIGQLISSVLIAFVAWVVVLIVAYRWLRRWRGAV